MKTTRTIVATLILFVVLGVIPVSGRALHSIELAYDDGSAEGATDPVRDGMIYAVRFTPPSFPCKVEAARFYVWSVLDPKPPSLTVLVLDASHNNIISPFQISIPYKNQGWYQAWFDVDLTPYNIIISVGDFYIGFKPTWPRGSGAQIGVDTSHSPTRSEIYNSGDPWTWEPVTVEWMVRAIVESRAEIVVTPKTLNLNSKMQWITAYIEPKDFGVTAVDVSTVLLEGTIPAVMDPKYNFVTDPSVYITDQDGDGIQERMVKFDGAAVGALLSGQSGYVTLTVTGKLSDGTTFEGSCKIAVK